MGILNFFFSGNRKNLILLSGGTLISQLIPFFLSPVIARLYTPDQFSSLELVLRISSFFAVISTLRFDIAIPLPKEDDEAYHLFWLSVFSSLGVSLFCTLLFALFKSPIIQFLENDGFSYWMMFVPILVFLMGLSQTGSNSLLRISRYKTISLSRIVDTGVNNIGKIAYAFLISASVIGLILPNFFGAFFLALIPIIVLRKEVKRLNLKLSYNKLRSTFIKFSEFPKVNLPNAIIDVLHLSLVVIVIAHYFGAAALGLYALKVRILKTPSLVIGNAAGQIFYQTASRMHAEGQSIKKLFTRYLLYYLGTGLVIFMPFVLAGPWIFEFVFGESWKFAGNLAQVTAPWMYFSFIASAFAYVPVILEKQKKVLTLSLINFALVLLSWVGGFYIFDDFLATITLVAMVESVYFLFVNAWYYRIVSKFGNGVQEHTK